MSERRNQKITLTFGNRTATLKEWAEITGKPYHTLYSRYKKDPTPALIFKGVTVAQQEPVNAPEAASV